MRLVTVIMGAMIGVAGPGAAFAQSAPSPAASVEQEPPAHAGHEHPQVQKEEPAPRPRTGRDDAGHQKAEKAEKPHTQRSYAPPLTDADRAAAFPDVEGHPAHDDTVNYFVLFDQLEGLSGGGETGASWDTIGWIGWDRDRFWFRTEGEGEDGRLGEASVDLLYGRAIAPWWDLVAGIRQDFRPGPAQTWAAVGLQGVAPYWFEVRATAYVGASGRTLFQLETEYELLLTNRLVLQPLIEARLYGKSDPERGIGAGLSTTEAGLRLRYELKREIAPYIGVTWNRKFFGTADLAEADGEETSGTRLTFGIRLWR